MAVSRPNIIVIMTDQQRADLTRREGYALDTTPFLDGLASRGVWFNRAYTATPVCVCARICMLTGRFPSATRVRTNYNEADLVAGTDLFSHFRALGYRTSLCGKNHSHLSAKDADYWFEAHHVGADDTHETPQNEAFDRYAGQLHMHLSREATPFPVECQLPYRIVSKAQGFIQSNTDQPFLLWLSFPEPHNPYQVPEPYFSLFPPKSLPPLRSSEADLAAKGFAYRWCRQSFDKAFPDYLQTFDRARANYHGMLRLIDDQVQRLVQFCEQRGLLENTIVIFLSDHGDFVGEYGLLRKGPELPEALVRIPLLITGPGISSVTGAHAAHVSITDLFPTLCDAVGSPIPDGVQGRSLWPLLTGRPYSQQTFSSIYAEHGYGGLPYDGTESLDPAKDGLALAAPDGSWGRCDCLNSRTQSGTLRMVRRGDWKLLLDNTGRGQLYNLQADPVELKNLYDHPEAQEPQNILMRELALWMLRTQDPLPLPRANETGRRYILKRP
jgi:arylsulfatase A-like enzyme